MSEAALPLSAPVAGRDHPRAVFVRVAWRNLWRRRLRTWMSAGGIAFAILLVSFAMSLQHGVYGAWIETSTSLMNGHLQVQHPDYLDEPKVARTIADGDELVRRFEQVPGVVGAAPRAEAFALVSVGERSFGGLVVGVEPEREAAMFALPGRVVEGDYLPRADSAVVGASLAKNLGVEVGSEIVALGASESGGVAALALIVDGIFETGLAELDRTLIQVPLAAMQEAFELGDAVHRIVIETSDVARVAQVMPALSAAVPDDARLLDWQALMPELEQTIELDRVTGELMYWLLLIVVAMSLVNAFIMTVFERTREFGMLVAIGMRPGGIVGMLTIEALCIWMLGAAVGIALCVAVVVPLEAVGFSIGGMESFGEMSANTMLPDRLRPALSAESLIRSPLVMLAGTLAGALIPAMRVLRMRPVDALREEE